jgi:hypothetical protein
MRSLPLLARRCTFASASTLSSPPSSCPPHGQWLACGSGSGNGISAWMTV